MTKPHPKNKRLAFIATILLLIAIPISVFGTQNVNDIRNRAAENEFYFENEFDQDFSTAYTGISYEREIKVAGSKSANSVIYFGCDSTVCGSKCDEFKHIPPQGLKYKDTANSIIWPNPTEINGRNEWPLTVSAYPLNATEDECIVKEFKLQLQNEPAIKPQCELLSSPTNLDTIPQNGKVNFIINTLDPDDGIQFVEFSILEGKEESYSQSWEFGNERALVLNKDSNPELVYSFEDIGTFQARAVVTDASGQTTSCEYAKAPDINIVIPGENGSPEFKTNPYEQSSPGTSLKEGEQYSYTLEAADPNGDDINYFVINETGWLNFNVEENQGGNFKAIFSGTPGKAGSYTVAVALNDGFHNHYSTQIWVINVDSPTNDTPSVTIIKPEKNDSHTIGDNVFIQWEAEDKNLIERFDVYLSTDPTNRSSWNPLLSGIGYNYDSYIWQTEGATAGDYYVIVEATDNQDPPATGQGVSEIFHLTQQDTPEPPDEPDPPDIPESYPRILNVKPADKSKLSNRKPLISADLEASTDNQIKEGSVTISLDDQDVTQDAEIRGEGENEGSVIFTPDEPLGNGSHKVSVSFRDTSDKVDQKSWTFTIEEDTGDDEDPEDEDVIQIFGFKLPKRVAIVVGVGVVLLLLAIIIPWLFYAAWRRSSYEDEEIYLDAQTTPPPPSGVSAQPSPTPPTPGGPSPDTTPPYYRNQAQYSQGVNTPSASTGTSGTSTQKINSNSYDPTTAYNYGQDDEDNISSQYSINKQSAPSQSAQSQAKGNNTKETDTAIGSANQSNQRSPTGQDSSEKKLKEKEKNGSINKTTQDDDNQSTSKNKSNEDKQKSGKSKEPQVKSSVRKEQDKKGKVSSKKQKSPPPPPPPDTKSQQTKSQKAKSASSNQNDSKTENQKEKPQTEKDKKKSGAGIDKNVLKAFQSISPSQQSSTSDRTDTKTKEEKHKADQPPQPQAIKPNLTPNDIKINNGSGNLDQTDKSKDSNTNSIVPPTKPPIAP
jgi:hypothetical protein